MSRACRARRPPVGPGRADGLRGVLDDRHAERLDRAHRRDVAEEIDDDDRLRARRERRLDGVRRGAVGVAGRRRRTPAARRWAGPPPPRRRRRTRGRPRRRRGRRPARAVRWSAPRCRWPPRRRGRSPGTRRALLEGRDLGPEDVLAAIEDLVDGLAQAAAQAGQRGGGIEEGDAHAGQPTEARGRQAAWVAGRAASRMPSSAGVAALAPASRRWPAQASCRGT